MKPCLMIRVFVSLGLISSGFRAYGQDFTVPSTWRKPSTSLSRSAMEEMAQSVVNSLTPLFGTNGVIPGMANDQPAYTIAAISRTDYLSGNTMFKQLVINSMNTVFTLSPKISTDHNSEVVMWGLAAASAYRAYNDSTSLGYAKTTWDQVSPFQIQPSDAAIGFASVINASIPSVCNGTTTAGGVFAYPINSTFPGASAGPTDVDGETLFAFIALSGHLYEFTGDSKYLDAATAGAEFLQNHMQNYPIVLDTFTVATCRPLDITIIYTFITGFAIWGLSVLASINTTWTSFKNDLLLSSVPFSGWTGTTDGIIFPGGADPAVDSDESCFKAVLIRGIHEAWTRMDPTSSLANYLQSYLYVQFNSIRDFAYNSSINAYSEAFKGPPVSQAYPWGQLDALDVLNSAFSMAQDSASPNASSSSTTPNVLPSSNSNVLPSSTPADGSTPAASIPHPSSDSSKSPIIVGVIVAVVLTIVIGGLIGVFITRRRRRARAKEHTYDPAKHSAYVVEPYLELPLNGQPSVPVRMADKGGHNTTAPSQIPSSSGTSRTAVLQPDPEDLSASHARLISATNTASNQSSSSRPTDTALPQIIANLTQLLSSLPNARQANEPPPQYEENEDAAVR